MPSRMRAEKSTCSVSGLVPGSGGPSAPSAGVDASVTSSRQRENIGRGLLAARADRWVAPKLGEKTVYSAAASDNTQKKQSSYSRSGGARSLPPCALSLLFPK